MSKLCFISYARNNNLDSRLGRFVRKLEAQIPGHLPHGTKKDDVVFFDVKDIRTGDEWLERLADQCRSCKVCVCFYSPPYFTSEYGGREVQVFLDRLRKWSQQTPNPGQLARAIIPVIWIPTEDPPPALGPFQYSDANFPKTYIDEGLLALAMRKNRSDAYNAVLYELTRLIVDTLKTVALPEGDPILAFDAVSSAFHVVDAPTPFGAALVLLVEPAPRAQPFGAENTSLDALLANVAFRSRVPVREVRLNAAVDQTIRASIDAAEMPLIVVDGASLASANNQALFGKIAGVLNDTATVVAFGEPVPNAADAAVSLRGMVEQSFAPWSTGVDRSRILPVTDGAAFAAELERRLVKVHTDLVAAAQPTRRAEDRTLAAEAEAHGIVVDARPVLTGPGGKT